MADLLDELRGADPAARRAELLRVRAETGGGGNWWLGLIEHATSRATASATTNAERRAWAGLAATELDLAAELADLSGREVASRKANLSFALSRYGPPAEFGPSLAPDAVARECLAVAAVSPEDAAGTEWQPRAEDVDVMRRLRHVRNVVAPAVQLAELVEDEALRAELDRWRNVLPRLP